MININTNRLKMPIVQTVHTVGVGGRLPLLRLGTPAAETAEKVDDPSQSARAFYVSSSEPKD